MLNKLSEINENSVGYLVVSSSFLKKNKTAVTEYLKAIEKASNYLQKSPEDSAKIIANYLHVDSSDVTTVLKGYEFDISFKKSDKARLTSITNWCIKNKVIKTIDISKSIDLVPLKAAQK